MNSIRLKSKPKSNSKLKLTPPESTTTCLLFDILSGWKQNNGLPRARQVHSYGFLIKRHVPGLVVMGGDSCPECRGFESQHRILDGQCFTNFGSINCNVERTNINEKGPGMTQFYTKTR